MAYSIIIFVINSFLNLGNLFLDPDHVSLQGRQNVIWYVSCFHFKIKDWKVWISQFYLYILEIFLYKNVSEIYIGLFHRPIVVEE